LEQDRNFIPVQPWASRSENKEEKSHRSTDQKIMSGHCHQVAGDHRQRALEGVLMLSDQSGRHCCDVTVGSLPLELGEFHGSSCLACCYGSPGSKAGRTWGKVPWSCVEDFSVKLGLGKRHRYSMSTWVTWAHQDWRIPFFMAYLRGGAPHSGAVPLHTWTWISPKWTQDALNSLAHPDHLVSVCDTCWLSREERCLMEVQAPSDLTGLLPCLKCTLFIG
jgi:hypothetical protein